MSESELDLNQIITNKRAEVQVNALTYDLEWITYKVKNGEIDISPAFQRMFEWDEIKQSRFIESLILNLPIPPIYLVEKKDGKFELLDGLQRICSYMHFAGMMPTEGFSELIRKLNIFKLKEEFAPNEDEEDIDEDELTEDIELKLNQPPEKLVLNGCDIVPALNGKTVTELDPLIQRRLRNKPIDLYIYSYNQNDSWIRYQMFTRMNSGGVGLQEQQIRNAQIRLINSEFIDLVNGLANSQEFKSLAERFFSKKTIILNKGMKLEETVLRFFAFANHEQKYVKFINPFLDEFLEGVSKKTITFDMSTQADRFLKTCSLINKSFKSKKIFRIGSKMNFNLFETVFITIFKNIDTINEESLSHLEQALENGLPDKEEFNFKGGGKNTKKYFEARQNSIKRLLNL